MKDMNCVKVTVIGIIAAWAVSFMGVAKVQAQEFKVQGDLVSSYVELRNAVLEGTIDILKKDPGADLSALTAAERAALADRLRGRFGLRAALAAPSLPRSTFYDRLAAASAPDPYAALRPPARAAFEASGRLPRPPRPRRARAGRRRAAAGPRRGGARPGAAGGGLREGGAPDHGRGGAARPRPAGGPLQLLRRRGGPRGGAQPAAGRRRPRPARLLGRRPRQGPGHRHHRVQAARRPAEGVPLAGRRPVRRRRRRLFGGHLAVQGARGRDARRRRGRCAGGATLHSDRGWRSTQLVRACGEAGLDRSMSRKGTSPDNAACEGFFGRLKSTSSSTGGTGAGWPASGLRRRAAGRVDGRRYSGGAG